MDKRNKDDYDEDEDQFRGDSDSAAVSRKAHSETPGTISQIRVPVFLARTGAKRVRKRSKIIRVWRRRVSPYLFLLTTELVGGASRADLCCPCAPQAQEFLMISSVPASRKPNPNRASKKSQGSASWDSLTPNPKAETLSPKP